MARTRALCFAAALVTSWGSAGCRSGPDSALPEPSAQDQLRAQARAHSDVDAPRAEAMQTLLDAVKTDPSMQAVRPRLSDQLAARLSPAALEAATTHLRDTFGEPLGILEEATHAEGALRWYSGLVLHGSGDGGVLTPVLYQFALDADARLARLQIREHWFIESLKHPAEAYVPVSRFHLPSRGVWTVMHGGRSRTTNYHHGNRAQRWAYDLVVKKDGRQRPRGSDRHDNDSYYAHGQDLLAPAAGTVVFVREGIPENRPPERGKAGGNGMVIDHGFGEYSALWHAVPGSLTVKLGDRVETGQRIGTVGNSGRSTGPHIHWHVSYRPDIQDERFGLPAELTEVYVDDVWYEHRMPVRGETVRAAGHAPPVRLAAGPLVFVRAL